MRDTPLVTLIIPGRFPSLNQYVSTSRANRRAGAAVKKRETLRVARLARTLPHLREPVVVSFVWVEPNRRRDVDNVCFAKKFILDGLVKAGVLENDNPRHVVGLRDEFTYDKDNPRVEVRIYAAHKTND